MKTITEPVAGAKSASATHPIQHLGVKIFADGADKAGMFDLYANPLIHGLTTNPTLMKKAGITDYEAFAKGILATIKTKPISFEVFSDEPSEMRRQAKKIAAWGSNVYVKIPVTNTRKEFMGPLIHELSAEGVKLNVTALLTVTQVRDVAAALVESVPAVVSVFAGRIADTGVDPQPIMRASVREVRNIFEADLCGSHIVTVPHDILSKALKMTGMDLTALSLDTVKMFAADAQSAGFTL
jgi:transaldolase